MYGCILCWTEKVIRDSDVRPDHTVSRGCHGREGFMAFMKKCAGNLSATVQQNIWWDMRSREYDGRVGDWRDIPKVQPSCCSPFPLGVPQ